MSNRSIVVTGGFGVLGRAVAAAFAAAGDKVARVDYAPAPADAGAGYLDLGGVDITDAPAAAAAVEKIKAEFGGIDVLVNVAGGFIWETIVDGSVESWDRMHKINVLTNITMTKATLPALLEAKGARIVNIGAGGAVKADVGMGAYGSSKSGVHRLTESLAAELADKDITVNAILPSILDTPTNRADMPDADFGTWVKPEAVAEVIQFLASPAARSVTGALIPMTRGA
jgi:NAD(P)-dependent dehydrogenase (short-subunit alcohol dehydrogenase family)